VVLHREAFSRPHHASLNRRREDGRKCVESASNRAANVASVARARHHRVVDPLRILLVEDNVLIAANLVEFLEGEGCLVDHAIDGATGLRAAESGAHDAVVLDLGLPRLDGLELCARLRAGGRDVPVLVLTARDTLEDKEAGFASGADDYLVKPFAMREVLLRLRALTRRAARARTWPKDVVHVGALEVDSARHEVRVAGVPVELNRAAFTVLRELALAAPNVVPRERLEAVLWDGDAPGSEVLRSHVYLLRRALADHAAAPRVETVRGVGHRLVEAGAAEPGGADERRGGANDRA
jgi:DNA-binding response OmpR family regulator